MEKRQKFTPEFKREAVRIFESGQKTIPLVAQELGLSKSILGSWVSQLGKVQAAPTAALSTPVLSTADMEAELKQLRKEKARLEMEVEILGKATAFFANRNR